MKLLDKKNDGLCFTCDHCTAIDRDGITDEVQGIVCSVFWYTWDIPKRSADCLDYTYKGIMFAVS